MDAQFLEIEERLPRSQGDLSSLADFRLAPGPAVDPAWVLAQPTWSLYCLDDAERRAIFVELPPELDLAAAPFVYLAQHAHAQRLVALPYAALLRHAAELPPVVAPIMVYITGRSGSTLLCGVLNELPQVYCLSEPDVVDQFVQLREPDGSRDAELRPLLDAVLRVLYRPAVTHGATRFGLKLRSEGLRVMDLFQTTFPDARNLFLYRDVVGFVRSFYRVFKRDDEPRFPVAELLQNLGAMHRQDLSALADYVREPTGTVSLIQYLALWWIANTELYLTQHARGMPALAVDYDDLVRERERVLEAVFDYVDLPHAQVAGTLGAFERDSQAGTPLARADAAQPNQLWLRADQLAEIMAIVERHPLYRHGAVEVPGLLTI